MMSPNTIGTLNEKHLHAQLKTWYTQPGDLQEVTVDGYIIDVQRADQLIEIQTKNFSSIKRKMMKLAETYRIRLVHPIPRERWIIKVDDSGSQVAPRRKSPKRGEVIDVFSELVSFPALMKQANFSLEVILIQEEQIRQFGKTRRRRDRWIVQERRLLDVLECHTFKTPDDFLSLLPDGLPGHFTTKNLADAMGRPAWFTRKVVYCLKHMEVISQCGKQGRSMLYRTGA
jgi:hypothetical protein